MAARRKTGGRRPITGNDLTRFQFALDPQASPDGRRIVFVKKHYGEKNEYATNLWMCDAAGGDLRPFTSGNKDSHPRWSLDGRTVGFISSREKSRPQIFIIPAAGGEAARLTAFPEGSLSTFRWSPDGKMLAVSFREQDPAWTEEARKERQEKGLSDPPRVLDDWWYRLDGDGYFNGQRFHLYIVDVSTGKHRRVFDRDTMGFFTFDFSPDSKQLAISANLHRRAMVEPWRDQIYRLNVATGKLRQVPGLPEGPKEQVRWSPDGQWIAYGGRVGKSGTYDVSNLELFVCDPVRGKVRSLTGREDYCLSAASLSDTAEAAFTSVIFWSRDSRRIYFRLGWHGEGHVASVARKGGSISFHTAGAAEHLPTSISGDGKLMTMVVGSPTRIPEVYVADIKPGRFRPRAVTDFNGPLLREVRVIAPKSHWVRAADGHRVQVWSLQPPGARRAPAILEIHGGPHAQYGVAFFHEFQVLAAAGYGVFFSNPRGSKGYGRDHCAAIKGSWGDRDWADLQAVIAFMKGRPWVDSRRLGVMGGSYGGYMTNWIVGHSRDFRAAITDRCVSNLVSMFGTSDFVDAPDRYWKGNSWDRPEDLWRMSPLAYFGKVKTPLLLIHSEGDLRCNIEQAEQIFTALNLRRIPARLIRYPKNTSHGMSRGGPMDMRLHRLEQILGWWREHFRR